MDSEQAWREYDALIRSGDFSSGSSDWGRRERKQRELVQDVDGTARLSEAQVVALHEVLDQATERMAELRDDN